MLPPKTVDAILYETRLRPHRSLSAKGFWWVMGSFVALTTFISVPFYLLGAWPVVGFFGVDIVLVWIAFRINFRDAKAYEDVVLSPLELQIAKVTPKGARAEWRFNPIWVRFEREEHEEFGTQKLALLSGGKRLEIAQFLGAEAKATFADGFAAALAQARRGPRYS